MSGSPRPKGREFNPFGTLAGSQTLKVVNGVFAGVVFLSFGLGYWFIKYRAENSRFTRWLQSDTGFSQDAESKITYAKIQQIRDLRRRRDDPYYRVAEEKSGTATEVQPEVKVSQASSSN